MQKGEEGRGPNRGHGGRRRRIRHRKQPIENVLLDHMKATVGQGATVGIAATTEEGIQEEEQSVAIRAHFGRASIGLWIEIGQKKLQWRDVILETEIVHVNQGSG